MTTVPQTAATEAAKNIAATQPDASSQSQPSVGQVVPQRSTTVAALKAAQMTREFTAEPNDPPSKLDLPIRSKNDLEGGAHERKAATRYPATLHPKWTCTICGREMQGDQQEEHLAGKPHIARMKRSAAAAVDPVRETGTAKEKTLGTTNATATKPPKGKALDEAKPRQPNPGQAKGTGTKGRKRQAAAPTPQRTGLPYPPDHLFSGLGASIRPEYLHYDTAFSRANENYALCDKDCGWCGRCMDGVDI